MLNRALVEGVGYSEAAGDTANGGGRALIMEVRKMVTHISKSAPMKAVFEEAQLALYGKALATFLRCEVGLETGGLDKQEGLHGYRHLGTVM